MNLDDLASRARTGTPGVPASWVVRGLRWVVRPLVRVAFRSRLEGVEHLPAGRPFILVANHSAGVALAEILCFAALIVEHVGEGRPLAAFAHPFAFHLWPTSALLRAVGAVPSTYEAGDAALASRVSLLIFPGGDHEAARPIWKANTVDFGGRVGFLRLARTAGVPIVPMGIRGAHFTAPILWCSRTVLPNLFVLMRAFRLKRYPVTVLGVLGVVAVALWAPWAWPWKVAASWVWLGTSVLPMLPWVPWTVRLRIGAPLETADLFDGSGTDDELRRCLPRVEQAVRALVAR